MLTIFTHCKAFDGHIALIQRNAIRSWLALQPRCEVILCGDRDGTRETAAEFGLTHLPDTKRSDYGTPLLNDLFEQVARVAQHDLLCFSNCDIVFPSRMMAAVKVALQKAPSFLLMGECWNLDVDHPIDFGAPDWEVHLLDRVRARGTHRGPYGIDFFVFPRGFYGTLPPFVLGTAGFDNWLIWRARDLGGAAIDATSFVMPVHQNHDYAHVAGGKSWARTGPDAKRNMRLAGGLRHIYSTRDATHRVEGGRLRRNWSTLLRFGLRWDTVMNAWWQVLEVTRPMRHRLGLRKAPAR